MRGIANIADVRAIEQRDREPLPESTYAAIGASAARHPESPALSFFLRVEDHDKPAMWSYRSLFDRVTATANFFHELGIAKDDVVAFVLPNLPETHFTIWGGQAAGIVFAINPLLESAAIADLLKAGGAKVLVTLAPFPNVDLWSKLQPILGQVPTLRHVVTIDLADHVRGAKRLVARLLQRRETKRLCGPHGVRGAVPPHIGVHDFNRGIRRQRVDHLVSERQIRADDVSSYFCTGGTTGTPKIAVRTHANEVANAWSAGQFLGDGIDVSKNIFCGLPLFHVNAVLVTGLVPFSRGAHVVLGTPQGYRGDGVVRHFWEVVERHRIHFFSGVPTLYAALLEQPMRGRDIRSLEYGLCGAAPMPVELVRRFQEKTGLKILEGYGLTEGTCVSTCNPPLGERRIGSIGLRVPGQAMKAVMLDDAGRYLRDCPSDEVGVLTISGPNVFVGYKVPEHNQALWLDLGDGQRWLNTGDLGREDADGYFYLTGRRKELIIRGGHNIDPASIEQPLHRHPAVQLAAAVGRPDAHAGELPVAYVQLKEGTSASEAELLAFAQAHIAERAALPKAIHVIPTMPLTGVGKIYKPELRHREIKDALGGALREAGVPVCSLVVRNDAHHGITLALSIAANSDPETAHRVLGQFPFRFSISTDAGG